MNTLELFSSPNFDNPATMWAFYSIVISLAGMIYAAVTSWIKSRQEEREAYYRAEAIRRIAEMPGEGAKLALEHLVGKAATVDDEARKHLKQIAGMRLGGLINIGVGIALAVFMYSINAKHIAVVGLFPGLIGVALLLYSTAFVPKPPSSRP